MEEMLWTLLVIVSIRDGGGSHAVTDRFGPFTAAQCTEAAQSLATPAFEEGGFGAKVRAYCIPGADS